MEVLTGAIWRILWIDLCAGGDAAHRYHYYSKLSYLPTSCCRADSVRPHRCCHLPNNVGSHRILPILHSGPGDSFPKIAPSPVGPGPTEYMIPWTHRSLRHKRHLDRFSRFSTAHGCDQPIHRHTDRPRYMWKHIINDSSADRAVHQDQLRQAGLPLLGSTCLQLATQHSARLWHFVKF